MKWVAKVFPMFFVCLLGFCFSVIKERTIKVVFFIWSFIPNLLEVIFNYSVQSEPLHGELKLSEESARPRECQAAKPRDARNEGGLRKRPSLAFRIIPLVIFVSRAFRLTDQEKRERLLVVEEACKCRCEQALLFGRAKRAARSRGKEILSLPRLPLSRLLSRASRASTFHDIPQVESCSHATANVTVLPSVTSLHPTMVSTYEH